MHPLKKEERFIINYLSVHFWKVKKKAENQTENRRKEMMNLRTEVRV